MTGLVQRRHAVDGTDRCGSTGARGTQRVAAFAIDDAMIAAYIGLLTGIGFASRALLHQQFGPPRTDTAKIHDHVVAFLTLPMALYVALSEASRAQATFGKRARRLRVTTTDGQRVPLGAVWFAQRSSSLPGNSRIRPCGRRRANPLSRRRVCGTS